MDTNIYYPDYFQTLYELHKESNLDSDFGMDKNIDLFQNGFGIYSSEGLKEFIGPYKARYYRIGLGLKGSINIDSRKKSVTQISPYISFTIPGQSVSFYNKSEDYFSYYLLFSEEFIQDAVSLHNVLEDFPFISNQNNQTISLSDKEVNCMKKLFIEINEELKNTNANTRKVIQLNLNLILFAAKKSLEKHVPSQNNLSSAKCQITQFRKLVKQHYREHQPLSFYANRMCISTKHLNRKVKELTGKTSHELINEIMLMEAKMLLRHTIKPVNEIAFYLNFNDPSYFVRFFKRMTEQTPQTFRKMA